MTINKTIKQILDAARKYSEEKELEMVFLTLNQNTHSILENSEDTQNIGEQFIQYKQEARKIELNAIYDKILTTQQKIVFTASYDFKTTLQYIDAIDKYLELADLLIFSFPQTEEAQEKIKEQTQYKQEYYSSFIKQVEAILKKTSHNINVETLIAKGKAYEQKLTNATKNEKTVLKQITNLKKAYAEQEKTTKTETLYSLSKQPTLYIYSMN